jgi:hypothetical protein
MAEKVSQEFKMMELHSPNSRITPQEAKFEFRNCCIHWQNHPDLLLGRPRERVNIVGYFTVTYSQVFLRSRKQREEILPVHIKFVCDPVANIAMTIRKIKRNVIASFEATAVIQLSIGISLIGGQFEIECGFRKILECADGA